MGLSSGGRRGSRSPHPAKVSRDLFVLHRGIAHMVEIKTPAGELSDPQQSVMAAVLASGGRVGVVRDADEMLELLDAWGILRARHLVFPVASTMLALAQVATRHSIRSMQASSASTLAQPCSHALHADAHSLPLQSSCVRWML